MMKSGKRRSGFICMISAALLMQLFLMQGAAAQGVPLNVRTYDWKSINSAHYEVIFPDFMEDKGRYVSSVLEYLYPLQQKTISPTRNFRFPVILNPDAIAPNGYVSFGPRRSVYYGMPDTSMPTDWFTDLAIHEGRHMFQFDAIDRNTVHALYLLFGENAFLPIVPMWWFEGDAVMTETVLTETGRGRNPSFSAPFKALMLEEKTFNYNKLLLGSYNDFIPNWYTFGYLMYAYIRSHYDTNAPETFFSKASIIPVPALGPHLAMKKATGKSAEAVYREMSAEYTSFWKAQIAALDITPVIRLTPQTPSAYAEYSQMTLLADGSIAASRMDYEKGAQIIALKDGKEKILVDAYALNSLSSGGKYLVWDELQDDVKFDSSRTRISLLDLESGKKVFLASSSRYTNPSLSPDGSIAVMLEWNADSSGTLVFMSTADRVIRKTIPLPKGEIWSSFSYLSDGKSILFLSNGVFTPAGNQGKRLERLNPETGETTVLLDAGYENIRNPVQAGETIFYVSNYSGIDEVWALEGDGSRYQVMTRPIGAYFPQMRAGSDELFFVDYADRKGSALSSASVPRAEWIPFDKVKIIREDFFAAAADSEPGKGMALPSNIPLSLTPAKDYSFFLKGNRVDSWGILPGGPSGVGAEAFVNIDNIASDATQAFTLGYDWVNSALGFDYENRYRGFKPDILVQAATIVRDINGASYNESAGNIGLEFPFGGGATGSVKWNALIGATAGGRLRKGETQLPLKSWGTAAVTKNDNAFTLSASYEIDPVSSTASHLKDHPFAIAAVQLGGPFRMDAFSFTGGWERREIDDIASLPYSRGYTAFAGLESVKGTVDYVIPVLYPDFAIGSLLYFNLITADAFYDHLYTLDSRLNQSSAGAELLFHFYPLQVPLQINIGLRYSMQIENRLSRYELVIMGIPLAGVEN